MRNDTTLSLVNETGTPLTCTARVASSIELNAWGSVMMTPSIGFLPVCSHSCVMNLAAVGPSAGAFAKSQFPAAFIQELPNPEHTEWPSHALEAAYGSMDAAGDWDFANAPADGPTAARFITQLWEQTGKKPIDGVIMTDPHALSSMLEATGPVQVSGVPVSLTTDNVVSFLTRDAYLLPGSAHVRRGYLGRAPLGIFQEFLAKAKGYAAVRALVDAAAAGHILMNATDPDTESDFQIAGVTGAIAPAPDEDLFALAINNLAGNRVDYYVNARSNTT